MKTGFPLLPNTLRVPLADWLDDEAFGALLLFLSERKDCVSSIAFFSSDFHPPQPLDTARRVSVVLKKRIFECKRAGFSCGVNVLSTIGHHPERLDEALTGPWRRMTGIDGSICEGSFCLSDRDYLDSYVKPLYEIYAATGPVFIWIDDDIRYSHIPIGNGCFCDDCVKTFGGLVGESFTREGLNKALTAPGATALRKKWLRYQSRKIADLLSFIGGVVRSVDDGVTLGFMTGERYFEGYDFRLWADALSDGGRYEIMWRPGGGAYTDRPFEGQLEKSCQIGRQCARLPSYVTATMSEIENFPYRILQKSPRSTALEVLMHVAAGCTGAALNLLHDVPKGEDIGVVGGHFNALASVAPFERLMSDTFGRSPTAGIYDGWHHMAQSALSDDFIRGSADRFTRVWDELFSLGLPECFDIDRASCYLLSGRSPEAFSSDELIKILSSGVYMDAAALETLNSLGYSDLTGFTVAECFDDDSVEVYADDPINEGFAGKVRLCPKVFVPGTSAGLVPASGARILCRLEDRHGGIKSDCSMGVFVNALGGRVCVSSHYAAVGLLDSFKSRQMKRLFRYLSADSLPFITDSCVRLRSFVRLTPDRCSAALLNTNLDTLCGVDVLYGGRDRLVFTAEDMRSVILTAQGHDGDMYRFTLPPLAPYQMALIRPVEGE